MTPRLQNAALTLLALLVLAAGSVFVISWVVLTVNTFSEGRLLLGGGYAAMLLMAISTIYVLGVE